jgi:hypothetical protein
VEAITSATLDDRAEEKINFQISSQAEGEQISKTFRVI